MTLNSITIGLLGVGYGVLSLNSKINGPEIDIWGVVTGLWVGVTGDIEKSDGLGVWKETDWVEDIDGTELDSLFIIIDIWPF